MKIENFKFKKNFGTTLVEAIFAATIFAIVAISIYQGFISINSLVAASRDKLSAIDLVNSEFELIRNLPYSNVGIIDGIPDGVIVATSTVTKDGRQFSLTRSVRNIDDSFDGTIGGSPNDLSPADYKMVQITITCLSCKKTLEFLAVANVAPKNLETSSTNGALFIKVFDANGNPVPQANVQVINSSLGVNINETTNNEGLLAIVDVPPVQNGYRIVVTKNGYTTDRTYAATVGNPNPVKLDATVITQQVTQISFVIDRVSTVNIYSKDLQCNSVPNVSFNIAGAKLIGTNPNVLKFSGDYSTDSNGTKILDNMEWDSFTLVPGSGFNLVGINPPSPFSVLPNAIQNVDIIFADGDPNNLLVTVKDVATDLPLSEVTLTLTQGSFSALKVTGRGYFNQTDWSGGDGQQNWSDQTRYLSDNGNIDNSDGELKLEKTLGHYALSGILVSSTFDTGTTTNFSSVVWAPTDQPSQTGSNPVKIQIATSAENTATTTWNFIGPDGTSGTYYTISNNNINPVHNGDRYLRYKVFLSTQDDNKTPNISNLAVTYTSDCIPPGQALFSDLSSGNHDLLLEKNGYETQEFPVNIITNGDWQSVEAKLSPN